MTWIEKLQQWDNAFVNAKEKVKQARRRALLKLQRLKPQRPKQISIVGGYADISAIAGYRRKAYALKFKQRQQIIAKARTSLAEVEAKEAYYRQYIRPVLVKKAEIEKVQKSLASKKVRTSGRFTYYKDLTEKEKEYLKRQGYIIDKVSPRSGLYHQGARYYVYKPQVFASKSLRSGRLIKVGKTYVHTAHVGRVKTSGSSGGEIMIYSAVSGKFISESEFKKQNPWYKGLETLPKGAKIMKEGKTYIKTSERVKGQPVMKGTSLDINETIYGKEIADLLKSKQGMIGMTTREGYVFIPTPENVEIFEKSLKSVEAVKNIEKGSSLSLTKSSSKITAQAINLKKAREIGSPVIGQEKHFFLYHILPKSFVEAREKVFEFIGEKTSDIGRIKVGGLFRRQSPKEYLKEKLTGFQVFPGVRFSFEASLNRLISSQVLTSGSKGVRYPSLNEYHIPKNATTTAIPPAYSPYANANTAIIAPTPSNSISQSFIESSKGLDINKPFSSLLRGEITLSKGATKTIVKEGTRMVHYFIPVLGEFSFYYGDVGSLFQLGVETKGQYFKEHPWETALTGAAVLAHVGPKMARGLGARLGILKTPEEVEVLKSMEEVVKPTTRQRATVFIKTPQGEYILGRSEGRYISFGGAIEKGETAEQAAFRELFEETGLSRKALNKVEYKGTFTFPEETHHIFVAEIKPEYIEKIKPASDVKDVVLVNPKRLKDITGMTWKEPFGIKTWVKPLKPTLNPLKYRQEVRAYEAALINYLEKGQRPTWLKVVSPTGKDIYLGLHSRYDVPFENIEKAFKTSQPVIWTHVSPSPPVLNKLFSEDTSIVLSSKSKRGSVKGLHVAPPVTTEPYKFFVIQNGPPNIKEINLGKDLYRAIEEVKGGGVLFSPKIKEVIRGIKPKEIKLPSKFEYEGEFSGGYAALYYAQLTKKKSSYELGIKIGRPKRTILVFEETPTKVKPEIKSVDVNAINAIFGFSFGEAIKPTPKMIRGKEVEGFISTGKILKAEGKPVKYIIAGEPFYIQKVKIVEDPFGEITKKLAKLSEDISPAEKSKILREVEKETGIDYSQFYGGYRYITPEEIIKKGAVTGFAFLGVSKKVKAKESKENYTIYKPPKNLLNIKLPYSGEKSKEGSNVLSGFVEYKPVEKGKEKRRGYGPSRGGRGYKEPPYKPPKYPPTLELKPPKYKEPPFDKLFPPYKKPPYKKPPTIKMPPYEPPLTPKYGLGLLSKYPRFPAGIQPIKYQPSLTAIMFGIKGKPQRTMTGFELRPVPANLSPVRISANRRKKKAKKKKKKKR